MAGDDDRRAELRRPPLHVHPHQQETFQVLAGTLDVLVNGEWREIAAGETITVAAATPHTIRNLHAEEVHARQRARTGA